jgi:hypothetical protein
MDNCFPQPFFSHGGTHCFFRTEGTEVFTEEHSVFLGVDTMALPRLFTQRVF